MGDKGKSMTLTTSHSCDRSACHDTKLWVSRACGLLEHGQLMQLLPSLVAYNKPCRKAGVKWKHRTTCV